MIREAESKDVPALVRMGEAFHAAKQDRYGFQAIDCEAFFKGLIASPNAAVFVASDGFICGATATAPTNSTYKTAFELFWWSEGRSGIRLRRAFEKWAMQQGCEEVVFSYPANEAVVGSMLERSGYELETLAVRKAI